MGRKHEMVKPLKRGDPLTAKRLNRIVESVNANTDAIKSPRQKDIEAGSSGGSDIGDESFTAGPSDITSTTVTITDDAGNDHDIERIDTIVLTETTSGRTMTLTITYV